MSEEKERGRKGQGGDRPITRKEEDEFGFHSTSEEVVRLCRKTGRYSEGRTIGVTGKWGSGKTSVLNMAMEELRREGVEVIEFNPWLRTSGEEIVRDLIMKIGKRIGCESGGSKTLRKAMKKYAGAITEGAGEVIGVATHPAIGKGIKVLGRLVGKEEKKSSEGAKRELVEELRKRRIEDGIIVVMVDDIDRLEKEALRGLLRGVRVIGDLPGVVYVMALDRETTGRMLEEEGWTGKGQEYLDKVLEQEIQVPILQTEQRVRELKEILKELTDEEGAKRKERKGLGEDVSGPLDGVLLGVLTTPRELKKFKREMETSARTVPTQVRWEDLLVLEAVRVAARDVDKIIQERVGDISDPRWPTLSDVQGDEKGEKDPEAKGAGEAMLEAAGTKRGGIREFITYLPRVDRALTRNDMGVNRRGGPEGRKRGEIAHRAILEAALGRKRGDELEIDLKAEEATEILNRGEDVGEFLRAEVGDVLRPYVIEEVDVRIEQSTQDVQKMWEDRWADTITELEEGTNERETWWACWASLARIWKKKEQGEKGAWLKTRLERTNSFESKARLVNMVYVKHEQGVSKWDEGEIQRATQDLVAEAKRIGIDKRAPTEATRLIDTARVLRRGLGEAWTVWDDSAAVLKVIEGCTDITEPRSRLMPLSFEARQRPSEFMRKIWGGDTEALRKAVELAYEAGDDRQRKLVEKVLEALDHPERYPFGP